MNKMAWGKTSHYVKFVFNLIAILRHPLYYLVRTHQKQLVSENPALEINMLTRDVYEQGPHVFN